MVPSECNWTLENLKDKTNPGMGGSEFQNLLLSFVLSEKFSVDLWIPGSKTGEVGGLRVVGRPDPEKSYAVQVSNTSNMTALSESLSCPLIVISHHPFDGNLRNLPSRTVGVVNVGDYQLQSNLTVRKKVSAPMFWCPVFLPEPATEFPERGKEAFLVGHISSLHPSKGFHVILRGWMKYKRSGGTGRLEVIGGSSLYGQKEVHRGVPASKDYAEKLLRIMGGEIHESVTFLGKVEENIESRIAQWGAAILNPLGFGESENVSMKECWRLAIPVIAGNRFGQRDYMKSDRHLRAESAWWVARKLNLLDQNENLREELGGQLSEKYNHLYNRGSNSEKKWLGIVSAAVQGDLAEGLELSHPPTSLPARGIHFDRFLLAAHNFLGKLKTWYTRNG